MANSIIPPVTDLPGLETPDPLSLLMNSATLQPTLNSDLTQSPPPMQFAQTAMRGRTPRESTSQNPKEIAPLDTAGMAPQQVKKVIDAALEATAGLEDRLGPEGGSGKLFDLFLNKGRGAAAARAEAGAIRQALIAGGLAPRPTMESVAAVPGAKESMAFLPEQMREITNGEQIPAQYTRYGSLNVGDRPGRIPGAIPAMEEGRAVPGLDMALRPEAQLTPDQVATLRTLATTGISPQLNARAKEAEAAYHEGMASFASRRQSGGALPERLQEFGVRFPALLNQWTEKNPGKKPSSTDIAQLTEQAFAPIGTKPIGGSALERKGEAEATQEEAKAANIVPRLQAELKHITMQSEQSMQDALKTEGERLYNAETWGQRKSLLEKQAANLDSEIKARNEGELHWKRLADFKQGQLDLAQQMADLAEKTHDLKLLQNARASANESLRALVTVGANNHELYKEPGFIKVLNNITTTLQSAPFKMELEPGILSDTVKVTPAEAPVSDTKKAAENTLQKTNPQFYKELEDARKRMDALRKKAGVD